MKPSPVYSFILVLACLGIVQPKVAHRRVITYEDFVFVGKFAYTNIKDGTADDFSKSILALNFSTFMPPPTATGSQTYVAFYVESDWKYVYHQKLDCMGYKNNSRWDVSFGLYETTPHSYEIKPIDRGTPHYWYVAMFKCHDEAIGVDFDMHFLNVDGSEYGQDEKGLVALNVVFLVFYVILFFVVVGEMLYSKLFMKENPHVLHYVWCVVATMEVGNHLLSLIHWASYGSNGKGLSAFKYIGVVFDYIVDCTVCIVLFLIINGYWVSDKRVHNWKPLAWVFGPFVFLYVILLIWTYVGVDPGSSNYNFATLPGYFIVVFKFVFSCGLLYLGSRLIFKEDDIKKKMMFGLFTLVSFLWFILVPLSNLIALLTVEYDRLIVQASLRAVFMFIMNVCFLVLLFPLWLKRIFVHVNIFQPEVPYEKIEPTSEF